MPRLVDREKAPAGDNVNRSNIIFVLVMTLLVLQLIQHYFFSGAQ